MAFAERELEPSVGGHGDRSFASGSEIAVSVSSLVKVFRKPKEHTECSLLQRVRRFVAREWSEVRAVDSINFTIRRGEAVALIGRNGAGKTTTIKMLTGILTPTSGHVSVMGFEPHSQRYEYTKHIGLVMGQKSLLVWDIPVKESLYLYRDIYEIDDARFAQRLDEFSEILGIKDLLSVPVRKLSLGQRMRAELASSLLHSPDVLFLDEPTIGLDVLAKRDIVEFIRRTNRDEGTTVLLTTHNMRDIEDICTRAILIEHGRVLYDGSVHGLTQLAVDRVIEFEAVGSASPGILGWDAGDSRWAMLEEGRYRVRVAADEAEDAVGMLVASQSVGSIFVQPPDLESVITDFYEGRIGF